MEEDERMTAELQAMGNLYFMVEINPWLSWKEDLFDVGGIIVRADVIKEENISVSPTWTVIHSEKW